MPNLNSYQGEVFPNFINFIDYHKVNMNNACLSIMLHQCLASEQMIQQFCKLARKSYSQNIEDIDKFEKLFIDKPLL